MRSREIEEQKSRLKLKPRQRSILIGTLLGDGHLETQNQGRTYRLKIEHPISQAAYVDWFYNVFKDWVRTPPRSKIKRIGKVQSENYAFQTSSTGQFRFYAKQFYAGRKVVPRQINKWLDPLCLAVWFMDDGSYKSKQHTALILNTHGFRKSDIRRLQDALREKFQLESEIRTQKDGLQIQLSGDNAREFVKIIRPHILPMFNYKFGRLENTLPKE